ncbi:MAG: helix-turn-helix transcriptional regulator [Thiotrichaceae bacterium]|nr:helix-turn-helix transcriptional regulator [Thiotrichaceae bacterium]PCI12945.1 MAG: hypothetical protein COB71_07490 [Thiotrichales bacterium]
MTILKVISTKESLPIGGISSPSSSKGNVTFYEFNTQRPIPLPNTVSLESLIHESEADPIKAKYLSEARKELSNELYSEESKTLNGLRLTAGLSQVKLAKLAGTTQSHLALIEQGKNDPGTGMIARIATALNLNEIDVFQAIRNQACKDKGV